MKWAKDAYAGERLFLFGTGPSLVWEKPGLITRVLENELSMGCNGLFLWEGMVKAPTIYTCIDHPAFPLWQKQIEELDTYRVAGLRHDWPTETPLWHRVLQRRDMPITKGYFSGCDEEFTWCAGRSNVVWSISVQLAYWLGFSEVYLLGVDGVNPDGGPRAHCYEVRDFMLGKMTDTPSDYNPRTIVSVRTAVPVVMKHFHAAGRKLINLNPDSFVGGIPKMKLAEVI